PIPLLDSADAILIGSPTHYANVTAEMKTFLEAAKTLKKAGQLKIQGKIGAAFGSYGWDGGWNLQNLEAEMETLGIKIENPIIESVEIPTEKVIAACITLGKSIAAKVAKQ
ncbi:MAG: flavodoxin, partial [Thermoproteota archaeon]|nr:flavodoxin [Thermoproteota archaeon]